MKPLHNLSLTQTPFQFAYNRSSGSEYKNIIHLHEGIEFHYIEQGEGQVVIGHKTFKISAGTLLFFQPFQLHKFAVQASDQLPFVRSFVVYDPNWLQPYVRLFPRLMDFHQMVWKRAWDVQTMTGLDNQHPLIQQLQRLGHLPPQDSGKDHAGEQHILFVLGFLDVLQQHWRDGNLDKMGVRARTFGHVELAMEWMEQNYHLPFHLQTLANHLHLSAPYLSALFRREVGENLTDYLAARRIQEACHLLMTSSYTLDRIAEQVGIPNVSYFCQMFKKQTGETPRRFRMKMNG
jgi:AraC-like DNA-binding protein